MNCSERKDQLLMYVFGELDAAETSELRAHLASGCIVCEGNLAEARTIASLMPLSISPLTPPAGAKGRLMERVRKGSMTPAPSMRIAGGASRTSPFNWIRPAMIGAIAASILLGTVFYQLNGRKNHQLRVARERVAEQKELINELSSHQQLMTDQLRMVSLPNMQMVKLDGKAQPGAKGMVCWEPGTHHYFFVAFGLGKLQPGMTYELWLVNDKDKLDKPMPAGIFQADANGNANLPIATADKMPASGNLIVSAVTVEPGKGGDAPSNTNFVMAGKLE